MKSSNGTLWAAGAMAIAGVVLATVGLTIKGVRAVTVASQSADWSYSVDWTGLGIAVMFLLAAIWMLTQVIARRPFGSLPEVPRCEPPSISIVVNLGILFGALFLYSAYHVWTGFDRAFAGVAKWDTVDQAIGRAVDQAATMCGGQGLLCFMMSNLLLSRWFQITRWGRCHTTSGALPASPDAA